MKFVNKPVASQILLNHYRSKKNIYMSKKINFIGIEGYDVYNISAPFILNNNTYIAGRVEKRSSEISTVRFFEKINDDRYKLYGNTGIEMLQDPSVTFIDGKLILCGTKIYSSPHDSGKIVNWNTAFYIGDNLNNLAYFANAPEKMKDVRICKYLNQIIVFTRPQGEIGGKGKIGFNVIDDLEYLNPTNINKAEIYNCHFCEDEWGGVNEIHILSNGHLGLLGHIASRDEAGNLHYYSMVFGFDIKTRQSTGIKIIAERSDFNSSESKRKDLVDVLFSGGIIRRQDKKAELYTGVSDAEAHYIVIDDPFIEYEK